jgi:hypothetical protein
MQDNVSVFISSCRLKSPSFSLLILQEVVYYLILVCIVRSDQLKVLLLRKPQDGNICRGLFDRLVEALRDIMTISTERLEFSFLKIGVWHAWL